MQLGENMLKRKSFKSACAYFKQYWPQDAKRPFQGHTNDGDVGVWPTPMMNEYRYDAAEANDAGFDKGTIEERSVIEELKRSGEIRQQSFFDKIKFWNTTTPSVAQAAAAHDAATVSLVYSKGSNG